MVRGQGTSLARRVKAVGLSWIGYENGREGLLATGGVDLKENIIRIVGTEGSIEIRPGRKDEQLRVFAGGPWGSLDLSGVTETRGCDRVFGVGSGGRHSERA